MPRTPSHYHVTTNNRRLSWAEVAETRDAAFTLRKSYRKGSGRRGDCHAVESCKDRDCPDYRAYLDHVASVPPVTPA